jgi:hypothetical protein
MWDRLIGALGVIWGGFILVNTATGGGSGSGGSFTLGQYGQMALAVLFIAGGVFYLLRRRKPRMPAP